MKIITCVTDTPRFFWECRVFLNNMKEMGYIQDVALLIFQFRQHFMENFSPEWEQLEKDFPEAEFVYFKDTNNIQRIGQIFHYIPIFRLWVLEQYFKKFPELENVPILYVDSDIIFTKPIDFDQFLHDDVNYVSWTGNPERTDNYLWQPYFDNKITQVIPEKLEYYKKLDVLGEVARICGTTRGQVTLNSPNIGGAQYLLKNINAQFWTDCFNACCEIKLYLDDINKNFMKGQTWQEKSDKGLQAFCSDMWAVLFTILGKGGQIRAPKELDFAWSSDRTERLKTTCWTHNAGITSDEKIRIAFEKNEDGTNKFEDCKMFYKGAYLDKSPFDDLQYLQELSNDSGNQKFCNNIYVKAILKAVKNAL